MLAVGPDELLSRVIRYLEDVVQVCVGCTRVCTGIGQC